MRSLIKVWKEYQVYRGSCHAPYSVHSDDYCVTREENPAIQKELDLMKELSKYPDREWHERPSAGFLHQGTRKWIERVDGGIYCEQCDYLSPFNSDNHNFRPGYEYHRCPYCGSVTVISG